MSKANASHHYYASNVFAWATAETRAKAIAKVLEECRGALRPDDNGGAYVWSCRVELPGNASYEIEAYAPKGVPVSEVRHGSFKRLGGGTVVEMTRVED